MRLRENVKNIHNGNTARIRQKCFVKRLMFFSSKVVNLQYALRLATIMLVKQFANKKIRIESK